jgi:hypothetical protein
MMTRPIATPIHHIFPSQRSTIIRPDIDATESFSLLKGGQVMDDTSRVCQNTQATSVIGKKIEEER